MSTTDELVRKLREWDHCWPACWLETATIQAADAIETLTRERDEALSRMAEYSGILSAVEAARAKLRAERDKANAAAEAHEAKWRSICKAERSDAGACACSYDKPDDVCAFHSPKLAAAEARIAKLEAALSGVLRKYVDLVNCGDCGNWNPETEDEVINARAALGATP